jgi:hypothetical protein
MKQEIYAEFSVSYVVVVGPLSDSFWAPCLCVAFGRFLYRMLTMKIMCIVRLLTSLTLLDCAASHRPYWSVQQQSPSLLDCATTVTDRTGLCNNSHRPYWTVQQQSPNLLDCATTVTDPTGLCNNSHRPYWTVQQQSPSLLDCATTVTDPIGLCKNSHRTYLKRMFRAGIRLKRRTPHRSEEL